MEEDKPFGWRPFTPEHRAELRRTGFSEEAIAEAEKSSVYRPDETAVLAYEIARATLQVLAERFGASFVEEVKASFELRAEKLEREDGVEGAVEASIMRDSFASDAWNRLLPPE